MKREVSAAEAVLRRGFSIGSVRVEYRLRAFGAYGGHCEFDRSVAITGGGMLAIVLADRRRTC